MDLHFKMGKVPKIREEFHNKRISYLKNNKMKEYIECVMKYDVKLTNELENNIDLICD